MAPFAAWETRAGVARLAWLPLRFPLIAAAVGLMAGVARGDPGHAPQVGPSHERSGWFYTDPGNSCYVPQDIRGPLVLDWQKTRMANQGPFYGGGHILTGLVETVGGNGIQPMDIYGDSPATGDELASWPYRGAGQCGQISLVDDGYIARAMWHDSAALSAWSVPPNPDIAGWGPFGIGYRHGVFVYTMAGRFGRCFNYPTSALHGWGEHADDVLHFFHAWPWGSAYVSDAKMAADTGYYFAFSSGVVLVRGAYGNKLQAFSIATGQPQWSDDGPYLGIPSGTDNVFYLQDGNRRMTALNASTGDPLWTTSAAVSTAALQYPAAIAPDRIVICADNKLTALDRSNGSQLWQVSLSGMPLAPSTKGVLAPLITGGVVWVPLGNRVYGYDLGGGQPVGSYDAGNEIHGLAAARGRLFLRVGPWVNGPRDDSSTFCSSKLIALRSAQTVRGRVLEHDGTPIPGAQVTMGQLTVPTDENGSFLFPQATVGQHTVSAAKVGYVTAQNTATVTLDATAAIDLVLEPEATDPVLEVSYYYSHSLFGGGYTQGAIYYQGLPVLSRLYNSTIFVTSNRKLTSLTVTIDQPGTAAATAAMATPVSVDREGTFIYQATYKPTVHDGGAHQDGLAHVTLSGTDARARPFDQLEPVSGDGFLIDTTAPFPATSLGAHQLGNGDYQLLWHRSASADVYGQFRIREGSRADLRAFDAFRQYATVPAADASASWSVGAIDYAGNTAASVAIVPTAASDPSDTTPPAFTLDEIVGKNYFDIVVRDPDGGYTARAGTFLINVLSSEDTDPASRYVWFDQPGTADVVAKPVGRFDAGGFSVTVSAHDGSAHKDGTAQIYVQASDLAGNDSGKVLVGTLRIDTTGPVPSAPGVSDYTTTTARVSYTTNEPSVSLVEYGKTTSYGQTVSRAHFRLPLTLTHSLTLTGLVPSTQYYARIITRDRFSNQGERQFTFITPANAPNEDPLNYVYGYVRDATGQGIGGVTVQVDGDATGQTVTSADGRFEFYVPTGTYTIVLSKPGLVFTPAEQTVDVTTSWTVFQPIISDTGSPPPPPPPDPDSGPPPGSDAGIEPPPPPPPEPDTGVGGPLDAEPVIIPNLDAGFDTGSGSVPEFDAGADTGSTSGPPGDAGGGLVSPGGGDAGVTSGPQPGPFDGVDAGTGSAAHRDSGLSGGCAVGGFDAQVPPVALILALAIGVGTLRTCRHRRRRRRA